MGFSAALTVNGTNNLLSLLRTAGYDGSARLIHDGSYLRNVDAAVDAFFHNTNSNVNAPGVRQVETLPWAGTITVAGNAVVTTTASGLTGSPVAVNVAMTVGMSNADKAIAAATALNSNAALRDFAEFSVNGANVIATKRATAANDATFNLVITDPNGTGVTTVANSTNTTAGSLNTTNGMPFGPVTTTSSKNQELPKGTDLSTIWLHTASSITINASING